MGFAMELLSKGATMESHSSPSSIATHQNIATTWENECFPPLGLFLVGKRQLEL